MYDVTMPTLPIVLGFTNLSITIYNFNRFYELRENRKCYDTVELLSKKKRGYGRALLVVGTSFEYMLIKG